VKKRFLTLFIAVLSFNVNGDTRLRERVPAPSFSVDELPADFYTFEPHEFWAEPRDSYWVNFSNWALVQQEVQSERIQGLGEWADRVLSGSTYGAPRNESYLQLGLATESEYGNAHELDQEVRFKLDLPTVEEKLRLVIESESDELLPASERKRDRQLTADQRSETEATGALRYLVALQEDVQLSNDVGARLRFPPEVFWRAKARKRWRLDNNLRLTLEQRVFYFHTDGWGARTWVGLQKPLDNDWVLLHATEANWVHDDRNFELSHVASAYKRLNNRATLTPRVGILGESRPTLRTTNVFTDMTFRYRLYDDWLFGEIIPALEFPREEDFKDRASLVLRVEMFFAGAVKP
jgi:hypothetical protein